MAVLSSPARARRYSAAVVAAAALGATVLFCAGAIAQPPKGQPPAGAQLVSKELAGPLNEARAAIIAKDWATAKAKLDVATPLAKTPQDNLALLQLKLNVAAGTNDAPGKIAAMEAELATNLLPPDEVKRFKAGLIQAYSEAGNSAKALAISKSFMDEYGGAHGQYASLAQDLLKSGDSAGALTYIGKAMDAAKAEGKIPEPYYRLQLRAWAANKEMDKYFAGLEVLIAEYPKDDYWKEYIANTQKAPGYMAVAGEVRLDVYRALVASGAKFPPDEIGGMAAEAARRGVWGDVQTFLQPLNDAGQLNTTGDAKGAERQKNFADVGPKSKVDKASLPTEEKAAAAKPGGLELANIGEAYLAYGDYPKAIEVLQKGIDKGLPDPGKTDLAKLHLGIAQIKAGQKDAGLATLGSIKADTGVVTLAHAWILIAKKA